MLKLGPPPSGRKSVASAAPVVATPVLKPNPVPTLSELVAPVAAPVAPVAAPSSRLGPPPRYPAVAPDSPPVDANDIDRPAVQAGVPARELTFRGKYPDGYGSNYKPKTRFGKDGMALPTLANPEADEIPY